MDISELIINSVCMGFSAGMKDSVETSVKDAFHRVKLAIEGRHDVSLNEIEANPGSPLERESLHRQLEQKDVCSDPVVLQELANFFLSLNKSFEDEAHVVNQALAAREVNQTSGNHSIQIGFVNGTTNIRSSE